MSDLSRNALNNGHSGQQPIQLASKHHLQPKFSGPEDGWVPTFAANRPNAFPPRPVLVSGEQTVYVATQIATERDGSRREGNALRTLGYSRCANKPGQSETRRDLPRQPD
jgi:hypothetical protein